MRFLLAQNPANKGLKNHTYLYKGVIWSTVLSSRHFLLDERSWLLENLFKAAAACAELISLREGL